jgi:hypothetical protein
MGVRVELAPHLIALMSSEDQLRYASVPNPESCAQDAGKTPRKRRDADERREQGDFANWLLLQNSKRGPTEKIPFVWHATHRPSKASVGTPDFWIGIRGRGIWIEFKRDASCELTPEQEEFRLNCAAQRVEHHVVYSAAKAIELLQGIMQ